MVSNGVVPLTRYTLCNLGRVLINVIIACTFTASLWVWALVFFVVVLLTLMTSQWLLLLVEYIRERRFATDIHNATTEERFCIRLPR
jgi:hypothetical protein